MIDDADNPASEPKNSSKAGAKSPVDRATRIQHRQHVTNLERPTRITRQNRRREPVTFPAVIHPWCPHLERTGTGHQSPLRSFAVTHHQTQACLINQPLAAFDINRRPRS